MFGHAPDIFATERVELLDRIRRQQACDKQNVASSSSDNLQKAAHSNSFTLFGQSYADATSTAAQLAVGIGVAAVVLKLAM